MDSDVEEQYLTVSQAAERLGLSKHTILDWCEDGRLPSFKFGRAVRIRERELGEWIEQQRR